MIKIIISAITLLITAVFISGAAKPNDFRIEQTQLIQAPASTIFGLLNDFHQWELWSPWEQVESAGKRAYGGALSGEGATYEWQPDGQPTVRHMEIMTAIPTSKIVVSIDTKKSSKNRLTVEFNLAPQGGNTLVTGAIYGKHGFFNKLCNVFFDRERILNAKLEQGLTNIKILAEK